MEDDRSGCREIRHRTLSSVVKINRTLIFLSFSLSFLLVLCHFLPYVYKTGKPLVNKVDVILLVVFHFCGQQKQDVSSGILVTLTKEIYFNCLMNSKITSSTLKRYPMLSFYYRKPFFFFFSLDLNVETKR